jgi:hypothetical protein
LGGYREPDTTAWDNGSWEGIVLNVRLIEIALSDEFRMDFVHRNDGQSRQQLDAHGTELQTVLFWEKVCRKFNDQTVMVTSCPLHANWGREIFLEIHDCNWKEMDALGIKPINDSATYYDEDWCSCILRLSIFTSLCNDSATYCAFLDFQFLQVYATIVLRTVHS